jgi:hypothetical protein
VSQSITWRTPAGTFCAAFEQSLNLNWRQGTVPQFVPHVLMYRAMDPRRFD